MMSEYFQNARLENVTLNNPNFSNVQGDQYNNNTMIATTTGPRRGFRIWRSKQEAEFEQYTEINRGNIRRIQDISSHVPWRWKGRKILSIKCEKEVFIGKVLAGTGQGMKVIVVGYEGRDAQKEWLRDFKEYSKTLRGKRAHLFAINRSRIPLLIFPGDLVPASHFMANVGVLGKVYFMTLREKLGWWPNRVWMDEGGVLCEGPEGPHVTLLNGRLSRRSLNIKNLPSSHEFLQGDVFSSFLTRFKSSSIDGGVVNMLGPAELAYWEDGHVDVNTNHPTIYSAQTNSPIAVGTGAWTSLFDPGALLGNGLMRFTLTDRETDLMNAISLTTGYSSGPEEAWLSQAWSVFHALGVSLEDDLSQYRLFEPKMALRGPLSQSESKRRRRRQQPIYIFIRPLLDTPLTSCTTPSLHYWSFDKDGRSPLSTEICDCLGLPIALELKVGSPHAHRLSNVYHWSSEAYRAIHQYQIVRGFDPTTTDFAQSIGYFVSYTPVQDDSVRFEEIDKEEFDPFSTMNIDDVEIIEGHAKKQPLISSIKQWGRRLKFKAHKGR